MNQLQNNYVKTLNALKQKIRQARFKAASAVNLEIEKIASPYGITLKDIKYDASEKKSDTASKTTPSAIVGASPVSAQSGTKGYGIWDLEFLTTSTYDNFMSFTKDLESNLRIVDISSISFSSDSVSSVGLATSAVSGKDVYKYDFKIKTYWLKN